MKKRFTQWLSLARAVVITLVFAACGNGEEIVYMGVSEYIMTFRINHAKELLLNSSLKVNEISTLCGFNDYNYFTKVFKNKTSYSPRAYRKKN